MDSWNFSALIVRVGAGAAKITGQVSHFPKVPIAASISAASSDVGTFGCYRVDKDKQVYGLTAGHVISDNEGNDSVQVYTPATKPYDEAIKSIDAAIEHARKYKHDPTVYDEQREKLLHIDREFGTVKLCATKTEDEPPHFKIDFGVFKLLPIAWPTIESRSCVKSKNGRTSLSSMKPSPTQIN